MKKIPYFEDLLTDKQSVEGYRQWLQIVSKFNTELLDYANDTFGWCVEYAKKSRKTFHNTLLGLARHNLVYMDCVKTLLANGNSEGCQALQRPMLEAMLGVMHIVEEQSELRALAYRFVRIKQMVKKFQMGDKTHAEGKKIEAEIANDMYTPKLLDLLEPRNYGAKVAEIEQHLATDAEFAPVIAEWNRLKNPPGKKPNKKDPEWYNLFGRSTTIRELATNLRCISLYLFLYKDMSNVVHAGCALDTFTVNGDELRPLRYPQHYHGVIRLNFLMFMNTFEKLASFYDAELGGQFRIYAGRNLYPKFEWITGEIEKAFATF